MTTAAPHFYPVRRQRGARTEPVYYPHTATTALTRSLIVVGDNLRLPCLLLPGRLFDDYQPCWWRGFGPKGYLLFYELGCYSPSVCGDSFFYRYPRTLRPAWFEVHQPHFLTPSCFSVGKRNLAIASHEDSNSC